MTKTVKPVKWLEWRIVSKPNGRLHGYEASSTKKGARQNLCEFQYPGEWRIARVEVREIRPVRPVAMGK